MKLISEIAGHLADRILADDILLPSFGGRARMKARIEAALLESFRAGQGVMRERYTEEVSRAAAKAFGPLAGSFARDIDALVKRAEND